MTLPGRVLVVAPHATRTGSTTVLLALLRGAGHLLQHELAVQLLSGGPLAGPLQSFGPPLRVGEEPVAVLANTAVAAADLARFPRSMPTAVYLHESGEVLATLPLAGRRALGDADLVVCVSPGIRDAAVAFGVDPDRAVVLPPIVPEPDPPESGAVDAARQACGATAGTRLVLGCGEARWAKGADLFVQVAGRLGDRPDLRFAWVGRRTRPFSRLLDLDVEALALGDRLRWVGEVETAVPFLAAASVVVAPSRDDAQPLVPLEAALVGAPTAAFAVGGLADLAAIGGAVAVAYPDTEALARAVAGLLDDAAAAAAAVDAARVRVRSLQAPSVVIPEFVALVDALAGP